MDLDTLRLFVTALRAGSFTAAAREAGIDPSSVSRRVAALERDLGVRLFERTTRRFQPTEAGRLYGDLVEPLVGELEHAAARTRDLTTAPTGLLRLTASVAFGCEVLAPLVPRLRARHPLLELELVLSDEPLDFVAQHLDLAIRLGPPPEGEFVRTRLMPVRHRVCASPAWIARHGTPATPATLAEVDCVRFPFTGYRSRWRFRDRAQREEEVVVNGPLVVSSALALKRLVVEGLGPGLLADWMIAEELADGRLVELFPAHDVTATGFDNAAWLLYASRSYVPLKLSATVAFLREALAPQ